MLTLPGAADTLCAPMLRNVFCFRGLPRFKATAVLVALCWIGFGRGPSWAQSEVEPNNSPAEANPVVIGSTISAMTFPAGDTDFFVFEALANRYYRIETLDLSPGSDTVMALYAGDGQTLLAFDDQSGEGDASKILWGTRQAGTFFVEVFQFYDGTATGSYRLIIADEGGVPLDDHSDVPDASATPLLVGGSPVAGTNEIPADVDYFSFAAQGGLFYDLETLALSSGSDTVIALVSPDGQRQIAEDDQSGRQLNASRIIWKASETNVFYLGVTQFAWSQPAAYSAMARQEGAERIPASFVAAGTPVSGTLAWAGEIDVWEFAAEEGHRYMIDLETSNLLNRFTLSLLATDGLSKLADNKFFEAALIWQAPAAGIYYLVVREDYEGGDYDLSVLDQGQPPPNADLNGDYRVDHADLYLFQSQWQEVYPTPTPE